jgi:hypothetical protein
MIADTQPKDPNFITTEFLALLLNQIETVYRENSDDFASIHALNLPIAAIEADEKMNERSAETILEEMALLADWMLGSEFSPASRARLEAIRASHPEWDEPETTKVAS